VKRLLIKGTIDVLGDYTLYDDYADEIDNTVDAALETAKAHILSELGQLGIGPVEVRAEL
jgi:hypothetical protein